MLLEEASGCVGDQFYVAEFLNIVPHFCLNGLLLIFQENETVVERALLRFKDRFSLMNLLPSWENRGLPVFEQGMPAFTFCQGCF